MLQHSQLRKSVTEGNQESTFILEVEGTNNKHVGNITAGNPVTQVGNLTERMC